jgi:hypothetical protein
MARTCSIPKSPTSPPIVSDGATQVLFRKDGIKLPVGSGALVRVNIGFDQGAPKGGKKKK